MLRVWEGIKVRAWLRAGNGNRSLCKCWPPFGSPWAQARPKNVREGKPHQNLTLALVPAWLKGGTHTCVGRCVLPILLMRY